nr:hypothetical protein BaRGS_028486 [Batillaria attramentaria]
MMWSWRKNLYLLYSAATYFCFLLVLLGLASSTWAENGTTQSGLLSYCSHDVWFDVCRTFCLLSAVLLFTIVPLSCYLHYEDERKEDVTLLTVFGVFTAWCEAVRLMAILSWVFLFTVFVLSSLLHVHDDQCAFSFHLIVLGSFAVPWADPESVLPKYDAHLSWGYALYILTHVLVLTLFITIGVRSRHLWDSQFRVRRALKDKRHRAVVSPAYYG